MFGASETETQNNKSERIIKKTSKKSESLMTSELSHFFILHTRQVELDSTASIYHRVVTLFDSQKFSLLPLLNDD